MRKGILLSFFAIVLIGGIVFGIWYINESGKLHTGSKDSFIPYNSALVLNFNAKAQLEPRLEKAFADDIQKFKSSLLSHVVDTLLARKYVNADSRVLAMRVEGRNDVAFLYVMDNREVMSRREIADFLNQAFRGKEEEARKYDRCKIYTLRKGKENVYFAVCGGIVLVSDSDLYIEDGLKQVDEEENGKQIRSQYENLDKYFSPGAGVNIFLNTSAFTDLLPLLIHTEKVSVNLDLSKCFKWGALDGDLNEKGVSLNGFMCYDGLGNSFISTLKKQQPGEVSMDGVVPVSVASFNMLRLSDPEAYFTALEEYRYNVGLKNKFFARRQQLGRMFGTTTEKELRPLLQGGFAVANMTFDEGKGEFDGVIIAQLKSGSLCKTLLERMMKNYARFDGKEVEDYRRTYSIDREKSFAYYLFPAEDLTSVYWGYVFDGIKNRYVFVEDNYLVFASSENAVRKFIQDYVHGSFIRDAEWYQKLRSRLSGKYNFACFSETGSTFPYYRNLAKGDWQKYMTANKEKLSLFTTMAMQWSNEGDMFYTSLLLNTEKVENDFRPHILWQTKLDARMSMKPVSVENHNTGEKELFVQDENHTIYLINDAGRILWKQPLDGQINSEVYQVDFFKNGKLQYLFSTPTRMYLIDRNGNPVGRFPLSFRSRCEQGITVYDYDRKKDYRIFAPCTDREVYLYTLEGTLVKGWKPRKADKAIVTKVQYFRVGDKDYLVFADRYRLYILDRQGRERVRVTSVFDLKDHTDLYLVRKGGEAMLAFANVSGPVNLVDFKGCVQTVKCGKLAEGFRMNAGDVNGDGVQDLVFTNGQKLSVYSLTGQLLSKQDIEAQSLDYPYVYRFSASDIRIGLIDREQGKMMLIRSDGKLSKGFPINGDSPFSIVFAGSDGFFLFAGADGGSVIKYRVQR